MTLVDIYNRHKETCLECKRLGVPCLTGQRILSVAATAKIVKKVVIVEKKPNGKA